MHQKIFTASVCILFALTALAQQNIDGSLTINNVKREYTIHLPPGYNSVMKIPAVFIFHGGGGNYKQMQQYMKMDAVADREKFICIYPNGINKQWNDGREFKESIAENDDAAFISSLVDSLTKNYAIDSKRIFATGISNGGFFSIFLAYKLNDKFLAVAPVCASIPEKIYDAYSFAKPVSVLLINGTKDPLVPFEGGAVGNKLIGSRGNCTSTNKSIEKFLAQNKITTAATQTALPDTDPKDGCTATQYEYIGGAANSTVTLVKIENGGHTLPGGSQYLPKFIIGKVCNDFKANETIWSFFKACRNR